MPIVLALQPQLPAEEFRAVLIASTLSKRCPVGDRAQLDTVLRQADVLATARDGRRLSASTARSPISVIAAICPIPPLTSPITAIGNASASA